MNFIFQLFIPFNNKDARHYSVKGGIPTPWLPPIIGRKDPTGIGTITTGSKNLNSIEKCIDDVETVIIPNLNDDYETVNFTNKETGEIYQEKFQPEKVIGINLQFREVEE